MAEKYGFTWGGIRKLLDLLKHNVSVSYDGTSQDEVRFITINGVEKKLAGSGSGGVTDVKENGTSVVEDGVANVTVPENLSDLNNDLIDFLTPQEVEALCQRIFGEIPTSGGIRVEVRQPDDGIVGFSPSVSGGEQEE